MKNNPRFAVVGAFAALAATGLAHGQGCLAAHTNSNMQGCITSSGHDSYADKNRFLEHHPVTLEIDWRTFSSFRHFSGTVENTSRQTLGNFIPNHQNLYNITLETQLTPR